MKAVMAIDLGTSSVRAGLVDAELNVHHIAQRTYRLETPKPGWAEQDPEIIVASLGDAAKEALAQGGNLEIAGVCIDSAMHSFLALDEAMRPITPVWTWADMRAARSVRALADDPADSTLLYQRTGCPVHAMYFPAKSRWLKEHDPDTFARAAYLTSIKAYVLSRLTGALVEDLSIASGYGIMDIRHLHWNEEALKIAGITRERLPRLVEPRQIIGHLDERLARSWGVDPLPIVAGGADGPLANVGAGCVQEGDMAITVGTSSAVRMFTSAPRVDEQARTWCYYLGDATWVVGGAINGGASSLAWLRSAFPNLVSIDDRVAHRELDAWAAEVPPGAEGLMFAPYLAGERNPGLQGEARGYMAGLSLHHSAKHFVKATMEGISYQIAWVYQSVADVAGTPKTIRITGGFVGSTVWPQVLADVLGRSLEVPVEKEGSLIGAASFGLATLCGVDWRQVVGQIPVQRVIEPNAENHRRYARYFETYRRLYGAVRPYFSELLSLAE